MAPANANKRTAAAPRTASAGADAKRSVTTMQAPGAQGGEVAVLSPELTALGAAFRYLFRAVSRMKGRDTHLAVGEISHAQFELLIELDERGELSAGELAAAARLTPATVTQMLDGLASSGHVERARSERDRRVVVSRLTAKGRQRIEEKRAVWQGRWEEALDGISERDLRSATRVLQRLGAMFGDASPTGSCEPPAEGVQAGSQSSR